MAAPKPPMPPGRRLRLDRRKALLDQAGLAKLLGTTVEEVSLMEQNKKPLSREAQAFIANVPAPVPQPKAPSTPKPPEPSPPAGEPPVPEVDDGAAPPPPAREEAGEQPAPADRPPKPIGAALPKPRGDEIRALEAALLTFFAGETFLVPRELPDGTVMQVEGTIPGVAQFVGMVDPFDGQIIATYAPGMARAWAQLAQENPQVRRMLNALTYGGAYRGVIAASAPAIMAIAMHHGVLGLGQPRQEAPPAEEPQLVEEPPGGYQA
jgi:hypothetical protein